ncbi:ABC transporter ATP-binding protein [Solibacillus sp. FSL R7-0668]|uniref:ABC transporter ATP-binding protein n=1 Tax=Solibacillus sp. FSL R7-0668 TaxID=2921688 RepID=UPI002F6976C0
MQVSEISYSYGRTTILERISFCIEKGQIVGLIGENGSGKSTLLQLLAGILRPTAGRIELNGQKITRKSADFISYQPDIDLFYENMTGDEVFRFYQSQFENFSIERAREIAKFLQVPTNILLGKLSKGNRGCIKLATFLARKAELYLLDEPFAGLDPLARENLMKAIIRYIDIEHCAVILSTHEVNEVEAILDHVILLKDGHIRAMDELEQIRDERGENAVQWMKNLYRE